MAAASPWQDLPASVRSLGLGIGLRAGRGERVRLVEQHDLERDLAEAGRDRPEPGRDQATPGSAGRRALVARKRYTERRDHADPSPSPATIVASRSDERVPVVEEELRRQLVGLESDSVVTSAIPPASTSTAPAAEPMAARVRQRASIRGRRRVPSARFRDRSSAAGARRMHGERLGSCGRRRPGQPAAGSQHEVERGRRRAKSAPRRGRARALWSGVIAGMGARLYSLPAAPPAAGYTRPACSFAT